MKGGTSYHYEHYICSFLKNIFIKLIQTWLCTAKSFQTHLDIIYKKIVCIYCLENYFHNYFKVVCFSKLWKQVVQRISHRERPMDDRMRYEGNKSNEIRTYREWKKQMHGWMFIKFETDMERIVGYYHGRDVPGSCQLLVFGWTWSGVNSENRKVPMICARMRGSE